MMELVRHTVGTRINIDVLGAGKPLGQGAGLGLSMIYGFMRQSGGQVRIPSEVGMGTTLSLYLPRDPGIATLHLW